MPLFALTIFGGAFLLFLVQPLAGKYLLPWFGGGPGVWTTCLLFFQSALLGGYAYAHALTQGLTPRRQAWVHTILLIAAVACIPIIPSERWKPTGSEAPVLHILMLLVVTLGLPYFALSATGPLLQRWFSLSHPQRSPYRLYALSNLGSLLALFAYPFVFEPLFSRGQVAWGWSLALIGFAGLGMACAWRMACAPPAAGAIPPVPDATSASDAAEPVVTPSLVDRFLWIALPAIASLLLVATTNKLCLDIAAVPFLWILPLAVYLLTFILCFDHPRWYARGWFAALFALGCCVLYFFSEIGAPPLAQQVLVLTSILFVAGMICHGELFRLRPASHRLTGYYLAIAAGGAAGSLFVALGAPLLFVDFRELQLGLVLLAYFIGVICFFQKSRVLALGLAAGLIVVPFAVAALQARTGPHWYGWFYSYARVLRWFVLDVTRGPLLAGVVLVLFLGLRGRGGRLAPDWQPRMIFVPTFLTGLLVVLFVRQSADDGKDVRAAGRNFYGAYKIHLHEDARDPRANFVTLANGGVLHGLQLRYPAFARQRTTYYAEASGLGRAFEALPPGPRAIGAVGLGAGTIASYGRPGDTVHFYEINPAIVDVATRHFTFLKDSGARIDVVGGDARLSLEAEQRAHPGPQFDLLALDAFSGDAIPVHLLTREAVDLYLRALKPGGIIAVHISNRHLDLRPVVEGLAREFALHQVTISHSVTKADWWLKDSVWMLLSRDAAVLQREPVAKAAQEPPDASAKTVLWTDDHASLLEALK